MATNCWRLLAKRVTGHRRALLTITSGVTKQPRSNANAAGSCAGAKLVGVVAYKWSRAFDLRCVCHGGKLFKCMQAIEALSAVNTLHSAAQPEVHSRWKRYARTDWQRIQWERSRCGGKHRVNATAHSAKGRAWLTDQMPYLAQWVCIDPTSRHHRHAYGPRIGPASL